MKRNNVSFSQMRKSNSALNDLILKTKFVVEQIVSYQEKKINSFPDYTVYNCTVKIEGSRISKKELNEAFKYLRGIYFKHINDGFFNIQKSMFKKTIIIKIKVK